MTCQHRDYPWCGCDDDRALVLCAGLCGRQVVVPLENCQEPAWCRDCEREAKA